MSLNNWQPTTDSSGQPFDPFTYKILNEGCGSGSLANSSSQITVRYLVEWDQLDDFIDSVIGYTEYQGGTTLNRVLPEECVLASKYFANRVDFEPVGIPSNQGNEPTWNKAKVSVVFAPPPFPILPDSEIETELDRFCLKNLTTKVDYLNTGTGIFKFCNTAKTPLGAQPGFLVPSQTVEITWMKIPAGNFGYDYSPMDSYVEENIGKINSDSFDRWDTAGQLLFMDYKTERVLPSSKTGDLYWDVTYVFGVRQQGWNYYWNNIDMAWQLVSTTGTTDGTYVYGQSFDFNDLFDPTNFD